MEKENVKCSILIIPPQNILASQQEGLEESIKCQLLITILASRDRAKQF
jgi:hypothetical protein